MNILQKLNRSLYDFFYGVPAIGDKINLAPQKQPKLDRKQFEQIAGFNEFLNNIDQQLHPQFYATE